MTDSRYPRIRAIVSDVDGTLLASDGTISLANRKAVARVTAAGVPVILATGRIPTETVRYYDQLALATPLVCYHGALVLRWWSADRPTDPAAAERLLDVPLAGDLVRDLINLILEADADAQILVGTCDRYVINRMGDLARHWDMSGPSRPEVGPLDSAFDEPLYKLCYYSADLPRVRRMISRVTEAFGPAVAQQQAHGHLAEFLAPGVSKAAGVEAALAAVGCSWSDVLAVGDYYNDAEMLRRARVGVAMAGAPDEVRAAADFVTADRDHDGVATALDRCL